MPNKGYNRTSLPMGSSRCRELTIVLVMVLCQFCFTRRGAVVRCSQYFSMNGIISCKEQVAVLINDSKLPCGADGLLTLLAVDDPSSAGIETMRHSLATCVWCHMHNHILDKTNGSLTALEISNLTLSLEKYFCCGFCSSRLATVVKHICAKPEKSILEILYTSDYAEMVNPIGLSLLLCILSVIN